MTVIPIPIWCQKVFPFSPSVRNSKLTAMLGILLQNWTLRLICHGDDYQLREQILGAKTFLFVYAIPYCSQRVVISIGTALGGHCLGCTSFPHSYSLRLDPKAPQTEMFIRIPWRACNWLLGPTRDHVRNAILRLQTRVSEALVRRWDSRIAFLHWF